MGIFHRIFCGIFRRLPTSGRHVASPEAATWPQVSNEIWFNKILLYAVGFDPGSGRRQHDGPAIGPHAVLNNQWREVLFKLGKSFGRARKGASPLHRVTQSSEPGATSSACKESGYGHMVKHSVWRAIKYMRLKH